MLLTSETVWKPLTYIQKSDIRGTRCPTCIEGAVGSIPRYAPMRFCLINESRFSRLPATEFTYPLSSRILSIPCFRPASISLAWTSHASFASAVLRSQFCVIDLFCTVEPCKRDPRICACRTHDAQMYGEVCGSLKAFRDQTIAYDVIRAIVRIFDASTIQSWSTPAERLGNPDIQQQ